VQSVGSKVGGSSAYATRNVRAGLLVPVVGSCVLLAISSLIMILTLLNQIGSSLHASRSGLNWLLIVTGIVGAISTGLLPALGSVAGQRRLLAGSVGCLAVGAMLCAVAPNLWVLMIGRVVGAFGVAATAISVAILRELLSGKALVRALGAIGAFEGAAAAVGFGMGGVVEEVFRANWRVVFWVMAVLAALAVVAVCAIVPPVLSRNVQRMDAAGPLLLVSGLVVLLLPITEGGAWGWTSIRVIGLFLVAVVILGAWIATESRASEPMIQLRALRRPGVAVGCVLDALLAGTVAIINVTVPSFFAAPAGAGYGFGASVLRSGTYLLPFAATITASAFVCGRLVHRDPRVVAVMSFLAEFAALAMLVVFHQGALEVVLIMALFGAGHGGLLVTVYALTQRSVRPDEAGTTSGLSGTSASVGAAIVTAVVTALLVRRLVRVGLSSFPAIAGLRSAWYVGMALAACGVVIAGLSVGGLVDDAS
jgi:predicted MFS family arabinose efflux permease